MELHDVKHAVPLHTNGWQDEIPFVVQTPALLQVQALFCASRPAQLDAVQTLPLAGERHAPLPSHTPFPAHTPLPWLGHSFCGSPPSTIGPQTPSTPCPFNTAVQASQAPVHAALQQTPSRQKPLAQCTPLLQGLGVQPLLTGYVAQAPAPSHVPFRLQLGDPSSRHAAWGSVSTSTGAHCPLACPV